MGHDLGCAGPGVAETVKPRRSVACLLLHVADPRHVSRCVSAPRRVNSANFSGGAHEWEGFNGPKTRVLKVSFYPSYRCPFITVTSAMTNQTVRKVTTGTSSKQNPICASSSRRRRSTERLPPAAYLIRAGSTRIISPRNIPQSVHMKRRNISFLHA